MHIYQGGKNILGFYTSHRKHICRGVKILRTQRKHSIHNYLTYIQITMVVLKLISNEMYFKQTFKLFQYRINLNTISKFTYLSKDIYFVK